MYEIEIHIGDVNMPIWEFEGKKPKIASHVFIAPNATIIGDVEIDVGSSVWPGAVIRGDFNKVIIGKNTNIQENVVIHVSNNRPVLIGDNVSIGHSATLHSCEVSSNVIIGIGSIILDSTKIGEWAIIGAGAVVPPGKEIPPRSQAMGIPASVTKSLDEKGLEMIRGNAEGYGKLAQRYLAQIEKIK
jgi:carbonic anhydrase/acetyltransferase-like protein (isoleucine patch superfamily)